ncbi:hypothetical protein YPPY09_4592, partial [Yersinia pestis PY-09]
MTLGRDTA